MSFNNDKEDNYYSDYDDNNYNKEDNTIKNELNSDISQNDYNNYNNNSNNFTSYNNNYNNDNSSYNGNGNYYDYYDNNDLSTSNDDNYSNDNYNNYNNNTNKGYTNFNYSDSDIVYSDYVEDNINKKDKKNKKKNKNNKKENTYIEDYDYYSENISSDYDNGYSKKEKISLFQNKKYTVIVIILILVLIILCAVLYKTITVDPKGSGTNSDYIRLFKEEVEIKVDQTVQLEVQLSDTSGDYKLEWFSSDDSVMAIDKNGNVTGIKTGEAYVLAVYTYKGEVYDAKCTVYVIE